MYLLMYHKRDEDSFFGAVAFKELKDAQKRLKEWVIEDLYLNEDEASEFLKAVTPIVSERDMDMCEDDDVDIIEKYDVEIGKDFLWAREFDGMYSYTLMSYRIQWIDEGAIE